MNVYQPLLYRDGADAPVPSNTNKYFDAGAFVDIGGTSVDASASTFAPSAYKVEITVSEPVSTLVSRTYPLPITPAIRSRLLQRNETPIFGFGVGEVAYLGASLVQQQGSRYTREHLFIADPFFSHHVQRAATEADGSPKVESVSVGGAPFTTAKFVSWWQIYSLTLSELRDAIEESTVKTTIIDAVAEDSFSAAP